VGVLNVQLLSMQVDNEFGVLTRITALIRREGWNIKSLSVAETVDPSVSCLTVSIECMDSVLAHVRERLERLDCVHSLTVFDARRHRRVELAVVRVQTADTAGAGACAAAFGARPWDAEGREATYEITGDPGHIDAFLEALRAFGAPEITRSGAIMITRGEGKEEGHGAVQDMRD
jgi:acetolactate synthase-1/3 small subunit